MFNMYQTESSRMLMFNMYLTESPGMLTFNMYLIESPGMLKFNMYLTEIPGMLMFNMYQKYVLHLLNTASSSSVIDPDRDEKAMWKYRILHFSLEYS